MHDTLTETDAFRTRSLLTRYGAEDLGDGDLIAGANRLAVHAAMICNLHPDPCVVDRQGRTYAAGTSLAISGDITPALTREKVFGPLFVKQNNLTAQHVEWRTYLEREEAKPHMMRTQDGINLVRSAKPPNFEEFFKPAMFGHPPVSLLLDITETSRRAELHHRPLVCIQASDPAQLRMALPLAHSSRPIVVARPSDLRAVREFGAICGGLVSSRFAIDSHPGNTYQGSVFCEVSPGVLSEIQTSGFADTNWMSEMPLLHDGDTGPILPPAAAPSAVPPLESMEQRIATATEEAWSKRLGVPDPHSGREHLDIGGLQREWVRFLKGLEPEFPGITSAARSLFATLAFGLTKITRASASASVGPAASTIDMMRASAENIHLDQSDSNRPQVSGPTMNTADIAALARFLVLRMALARRAAVGGTRVAQLHRVASRIVHKLEGDSLTPREISRKTSKLSVSDCRDALDLLLRAGAVNSEGDKWTLNSSAAEALNKLKNSHLTIDV